MVEKAKNPRKGSITEEDIATLLQRYQPTTVLSLLQEVACYPEVKIDWDQLVARTSTGISNAREYQMLWRHLAYREGLIDNCGNGAQFMDDDSDLEYELEACPAVSAEDSTEAAACVKVLIASGLASDSTHRSGATVEAPLTINVPNDLSSRTNQSSQPTCSMQRLNITVPVTVQKQALPAVATSTVASAEGGGANGSASNSTAPRRKRKKWSAAEDLELIAGVRKYGEANWSNIIRGDFKGERNANQLAQRWSYIKKNHRDLLRDVDLTGSSSRKLSQAQLDARYSLSMALDMPKRKAKTIGTARTNAHSKFTGTNATSNSVLTTAAEEEPKAQQGLDPEKNHYSGINAESKTAGTNAISNSVLTTAAEAEQKAQQGLNPAKNHYSGTNAYSKFTGTNATSNSVVTTAAEAKPKAQQGPNPAKPHQVGLLGSTTKSQVTSQKTLTKPNTNSDGMIRATAVAAGARIGFSSDAASLVKTVQATTAVHIMPTVGSSIQSSLPGGMRTHSELPPNVHYRRTSLAAAPLSTPPSTVVTPGATHPRSLKALPQGSLHTPTNDTLLSKRINGVTCSLDAEAELSSKQVVVTAEGRIIAEQGCAPTEQVQGGAVIARNGQDEQVQEDKVDSPDQKAELKNILSITENHVGSLNIERDETGNEAVISVQAEERRNANDNMILCSLGSVGGGDPYASEEQTELMSIATDGCNGKQVSSKEEAGIKI